MRTIELENNSSVGYTLESFDPFTKKMVGRLIGSDVNCQVPTPQAKKWTLYQTVATDAELATKFGIEKLSPGPQSL